MTCVTKADGRLSSSSGSGSDSTSLRWMSLNVSGSEPIGVAVSALMETASFSLDLSSSRPLISLKVC